MELPVSKARHDEFVRYYAFKLLSEGYDVRARVEGWFELPDYILGYRPDIVAKKGDYFIICEITKGPVDWPKIAALERFSQEHKNFDIKIVDPAAEQSASHARI